MTDVQRVVLGQPVPHGRAREMANRMFFVSEEIIDFTLVDSSEGVVAVDVDLVTGADVAEVTRKLLFVVDNDVRVQRELAPKIRWRGATTGDAEDVFEELVEHGIASEAGEGQMAIGEPVISLMDYFDDLFTSLAVEDFGARKRRYPTLIPTEVIQRGGYLKSSPQLMMFVSRLHSDVDTYRDFRATTAGEVGLADALREHCDNFDYCLPPTMCFHTYYENAGRSLSAPALAVTSRGKSFRFESRYRRSLERLWDFTIREVVFLGSRDYVTDSRKRFMERSCEVIDSLGLGGTCEVATDPFFADADTAERVWSQQLLELKYELRLPLDGRRDLAVCSFNFHEQFFGTAFGITTGADPVFTSCAGFGLERLAYAFLCRYGIDVGGWPGPVRRAFG